VDKVMARRRGKRVTVTLDHDIWEWAVMEAKRKGMTLSQELRWITRDGVAHRQGLERQYRALAVEEAKYGR